MTPGAMNAAIAAGGACLLLFLAMMVRASEGHDAVDPWITRAFLAAACLFGVLSAVLAAFRL